MHNLIWRSKLPLDDSVAAERSGFLDYTASSQSLFFELQAGRIRHFPLGMGTCRKDTVQLQSQNCSASGRLWIMTVLSWQSMTAVCCPMSKIHQDAQSRFKNFVDLGNFGPFKWTESQTEGGFSYRSSAYLLLETRPTSQPQLPLS